MASRRTTTAGSRCRAHPRVSQPAPLSRYFCPSRPRRLPRRRGSARLKELTGASAPERSARSSSSSSPPATPEARAKARVLVVDDDAAMGDMLREALEDSGYDVEVAAGGRPAVARVRQGGIDLVVSDVKMPDLDGLDLLREIKAVEPSPHVITFTAFGSLATAIRAVKLGAFDYITKPFAIAQLLLSVDKALSARALRSEVARLRDAVARSYRLGNLIGRSAVMQEI